MLATVIRSIPKLSRTSLRVTSVNKRTMLAIGEQLNKKEKVEEDRYMRAQEEAWKEKLRKLRAQEEAEREEVMHKEVVDPVKADISKMLARSGDKVSDAGLEILAKWKLDL